MLERFLPWLQSLARVSEVTWVETLPAAATCVVNDFVCAIPLAGIIDPNTEQQRIDGALKKLEQDITLTKTPE